MTRAIKAAEMSDMLGEDYAEWRKTWQEIGDAYQQWQDRGCGQELAAWMAYDEVVLRMIGVRQ